MKGKEVYNILVNEKHNFGDTLYLLWLCFITN